MSDADIVWTPEAVEGWHAHVYYDEATRSRAERLRADLAEAFPTAQLGRWRETPVGPHPMPMYQVAFEAALFTRMVPWLLAHRGPLPVLVHARTGLSDLIDHTRGALWLGDSLPLTLAFFSEDGRSA